MDEIDVANGLRESNRENMENVALAGPSKRPYDGVPGENNHEISKQTAVPMLENRARLDATTASPTKKPRSENAVSAQTSVEGLVNGGPGHEPQVYEQDESVCSQPAHPVTSNRPAGSPRISRSNSQASLLSEPGSSDSTLSIPREHVSRVKVVDSDGGDKEYLCLICGFRSGAGSAMFDEHQSHHNKRGKHTASCCRFSSDDYKVVNQHLEDHKRMVLQSRKTGRELLIYRCRHCPFETVFYEDYSDHIMFHTDKGRFHCSLCTYCSNDQAKVVEHESLHYIPKLFFVDGYASIVQKYCPKNDRTPFFLDSDIHKAKKVIVKPKLSEAKKDELRRFLSKVVNPKELQ